MPRFLGTITYIGSDGVQHTLDEYNGNVIDAGNGGLAIKEYPDGASNGGSVANNTTMAMSLGEGTYTESDNQFVVGKYNNNDSNNLFEVGNGASNSDRSNAFEVTEDGIARAYSAPSGPNDLVRAQDLNPIVKATVAISSDNLTLTLSAASPLPSSWYKFVDWGDGNFSEFSNEHTYNTQGTYTCVFYGVTTIGTRAFYDCTSLTSVTIPDSVTSIGNSAFAGCTSLTSVAIGSGVTSIGYEAFYGCISLTSITISNSVTSIGTRAFYYCTSLTSVTIPNGVTSIGDQTFYHCTSLTSVAIGSGVTSIGNEAFYYCTNLKSITIPPVSSSPTTTIGTNVFTVPSGSSLRNGQIYYAGSEEIDENSAWNGKLPGDFTINYNCTPIDLSKYTIIKTTDQSVQGSDGVIVLITEASV